MLAAATPVFTTKCRVELACTLVIKPPTFSLHVITSGGTRMSTGILINSAADGTTPDVGHKGPGTPEPGWAGTPTVPVGTAHPPPPLLRPPLEAWKDMAGDEYGEVDVLLPYCAEVATGVCPLGTNKRAGDPNPACYHGVEAKETK